MRALKSLSSRVARRSAAVFLCGLLSVPLVAHTGRGDVLTSRQDDERTGAALSERLLTPAAIEQASNPDAFGLLFSYPLAVGGVPAGDVYAQPLYVANVGLPGHGTVNLLLVATMKNVVFAFDADGPHANQDGLVWRTSLGPAPTVDDVWRNCSLARPCTFRGDNMRGNVGISGTPVVDRQRGIVFVVARVLVDADHVVYRLHALDLRSGKNLAGSPAQITGGSVNVAFNPNYQNQRAGLALARGQVIVAFGAYADALPYHGWVFSYRYNAGTGFVRSGVFVSTPDGDMHPNCNANPRAIPRNPANNCAHGGIWMAGRAPAVDADGRVLLMVGNGFNELSATTRNFGNSLVALHPATLAVLDFFTPENHVTINAADLDLGGSGPLIIPGSRFVVGGGKEGVMHAWRIDHLGRFGLGDPGAIQKFAAGIVKPHADTGNDMAGGATGGAVHSDHAGHIMGGPVFWPRAGGARLYNWSENSELRAFAVDAQAVLPIRLPAVAQGPDIQAGHPGGILTLSANGSAPGSGIVWASTYDATNTTDPFLGVTGALNRVVPGILRAYAAENLIPLWTSELTPARDRLGNFAKFNPPTVANGRVYMATFSDKIMVYGLLKHKYSRPAEDIMKVISRLLDQP